METSVLIKIICILGIVPSIKVQAAVTVSDEQYELMPPLFRLDNFDHCLSLGKDSLYCTASIYLEPADSSNSSNVWKIIQEVSRHPKNYKHDYLRHGICVSDSCPELRKNLTFYKNNKHLLREQLSKCYTEKYEDLGLKGVTAEEHCETQDSVYDIDIYDILVGTFLLAWLAIVVFATIYESRAKNKSKEDYEKVMNSLGGKLLSCFAIQKNWKHFINSSSNPKTAPLKCISGVRFYNMIGVITAHTALGYYATASLNPTFLERITDCPLSMFLLNGTFVIQTFFVLAGWLLSYNVFLLAEKEKSFKFSYLIRGFIRRYIRLTPCLLVIIAVVSTWLYHFGRGPYWDRTVGLEYRNCRNNWWINLLYINNYYDVENMCLQQTWYVAVDTQAFIISLLLLVIVWKYQQHVKAILIACFVVSASIPGIINYIQDYDIVIRFYPEALYNCLLTVPQWHVMYSSAYTNMGSYITGLMSGYLYYKHGHEKVFKKKIHVALWWLLGCAMPVLIVLTGIPIYSDNYQHSRFAAALYVSLSRNLFGIGAAVFVFGLTQGLGSAIRDATTFPFVRIMGKLTYSVYLVHTAVVRVRMGLIRSPSYVNPYIMVADVIENIAMSYIIALMLYLCVEMPVAALQKFASTQPEQKKEQAESTKVDITNGNVTTVAHISKM